MTDSVLHYEGKPITDMSKDELVNALTWAVKEIEYQRERASRYMQIAVLSS